MLNDLMRPNLRRRRVDAMVAAVLQQIGPYLSDERHARRDAAYALMNMFWEEGVEVVTDHVRQEAGLPPRGPDGWTAEELIALEQRRLEAMLRPLSVTIPIKEPG
jgi:hypothetical protein